MWDCFEEHDQGSAEWLFRTALWRENRDLSRETSALFAEHALDYGVRPFHRAVLRESKAL